MGLYSRGQSLGTDIALDCRSENSVFLSSRVYTLGALTAASIYPDNYHLSSIDIPHPPPPHMEETTWRWGWGGVSDSDYFLEFVGRFFDILLSPESHPGSQGLEQRKPSLSRPKNPKDFG